MRNIFQGNKTITSAVAKELGYDPIQEHSWFTQDIYFQTFFYLSKRFGPPNDFDDSKEAGAWSFRCKDYIIQIRLNSSWVEFMIYGNRIVPRSPYEVKYKREWSRKRDKLIPIYCKWSDKEKLLADELFKKFVADKNITEGTTQKEFDNNYGFEWLEEIKKYNDSIIGINLELFYEKYGDEYTNSFTRHAIETLRKFIRNMLSPIWVRDVPYNIKGRLFDADAMRLGRFSENVKIEFFYYNQK